MGLFGESKTDTSQNEVITQIQKTLAQVVANQNMLIKSTNTWFEYLNKTFFPQFNILVQRVADGEKLDAQQQAALDGLVKTAISIQQANKEVGT